jgi:hypothetical protein
MARLPPLTNSPSRKHIHSLERDITGAIQGQCLLLVESQRSSIGAIRRAMRYLQLRDQGHSQLSSIRGAANALRLSPRYRPYQEPQDYINYEAIEAAYRRFEQRNVVVNGRIRSRSHRRVLSDYPSKACF